MAAEPWRAEVDHYLPLIARVITQSQAEPSRRGGAGENLGSGPGLFEPHADIIVKGGRAVQYGHKLNLVTGKSGLIIEVVVEAGDNLKQARRAACRMSPSTRNAISPWPRWSRALGLPSAAQLPRRDRSRHLLFETSMAVHAAPGPRRGRLWRGLDHLKAYIWSAVVAHNLMLFSCLRPTYLRLLAPVTGAGPVRPDHSCTKANPLLPVSTAT